MTKDHEQESMPRLSVEKDGRAVLSGELTLDTVGSVFAQVKQYYAQGGLVTDVDLGAVGRVDSAGLALLLEWQALQSAKGPADGGGRFRTINVPLRVLRLAKLCEGVALLQMSARVEA